MTISRTRAPPPLPGRLTKKTLGDTIILQGGVRPPSATACLGLDIAASGPRSVDSAVTAKRSLYDTKGNLVQFIVIVNCRYLCFPIVDEYRLNAVIFLRELLGFAALAIYRTSRQGNHDVKKLIFAKVLYEDFDD